MNLLTKIKCLLNRHIWIYNTPNLNDQRQCFHCHKEQSLIFKNSGMTEMWINTEHLPYAIHTPQSNYTYLDLNITYPSTFLNLFYNTNHRHQTPPFTTISPNSFPTIHPTFPTLSQQTDELDQLDQPDHITFTNTITTRIPEDHTHWIETKEQWLELGKRLGWIKINIPKDEEQPEQPPKPKPEITNPISGLQIEDE